MGKKVSIQNFELMNLTQTAHLINPNQSQYCENADTRQGSLTSFPDNAAVSTLTGVAIPIKSIYRFGADPADDDSGSFFNWNVDVDVVKGPVPSDAIEMTYFTGDGDPKFTDSNIALSGGGVALPNNSFLLGIPKPASVGTLVVSGTAPPTSDLYVNRSYAIAFVGSRGEVGPPVFSGTQQVGPDQQVDLSVMPTVPSGNYDITKKRIYRTATGQGTTRFFLVAEVTIAQTTYSDSLADTGLGVEMTSLNYYPPPAAAHSLLLMSNGIMIMAKENRLVPSEPFLPHAYNPLNEKATDYDIVGLGTFKNTAVALTSASPWLASGSDPRSFNLVEIKEWPGCASKRSIASSDDGVIYASKEGLILIGQAGIINLSLQHMTIEDWQAFKPESIYGAIWQDHYICFYNTGAAQGGLVFHLGKYKRLGFTHFNPSPIPDEVFVDHINRRCYFASGTVITRLERDNASNCVWESPDYIDPRKNPFTAVRILADVYENLTLKVYQDDVLTVTKSITSSNVFRIAPGSPTLKYKFRIEMSSTSQKTNIIQFDAAETVNDLYKRV